MNSFWISALVLALVVVLILLISSRSRTQAQAVSADGGAGDSADATFYKSQLKALEKDKEVGLLEEEQYQVARAELAREALASQKVSEVKRTRGHWSLGYSLLSIGAFLAIGIGTYFLIGSPSFRDQPLATRLAAIENLDVNDAVAQIEAQLQATPDDIRGWRVLVPVYVRQGEVDKAINAFENIIRIEGENAENVTDLAEAQLMKAEGDPTQQTIGLLEKAAQLDSLHVRSRFYLANIALRNEEFEQAKQRWQELLDIAQGSEAWIGSARNGLAAARAGLGEGGPSPEEIEAAAQMDAEDRNEMIAQMVAGLAERLYAEGGNVEEWARLIKSRIVLGQYDNAQQDISAARRAHENDAAQAQALEAAIAQDIQQLEKEQSQ